jgi:ribosomal protein S11
MQKQKKNQKFFKKYNKKDSFYKTKGIVNLKKYFKKTSLFIGASSQKFIFESSRKFRVNLFAVIRVTPNNIFCTLFELRSGKILYVLSAGKLKIKISKKGLKFSSKIIIQSFINRLRKYPRKHPLFVRLVGPIKIRKQILRQITPLVAMRRTVITVKENKPFNGCRPSKKKRQKRKGLKV